MAVVRILAGPDGRAEIEEIGIAALAAFAKSVSALPGEQVPLKHLRAGQVAPELHPAPRRQLVAIVSGRMEVEVGDGSRRQFGLGDIVVMDDTTGEGHIVRHFGDFCAAIIPLA